MPPHGAARLGRPQQPVPPCCWWLVQVCLTKEQRLGASIMLGVVWWVVPVGLPPILLDAACSVTSGGAQRGDEERAEWLFFMRLRFLEPRVTECDLARARGSTAWLTRPSSLLLFTVARITH